MEMSLLILCLFASAAVASKFVLHGHLRDHPHHKHHMLLETPLVQNSVDELEDLLTRLKSRSKRTPKRRCGTVLLSDMVRLCQGCLDTPDKRSISRFSTHIPQSMASFQEKGQTNN